MRKPTVIVKPETVAGDMPAPTQRLDQGAAGALGQSTEKALPEVPREGGSYFVDPDKGTVEKREGTIPFGHPDHEANQPAEATPAAAPKEA